MRWCGGVHNKPETLVLFHPIDDYFFACITHYISPYFAGVERKKAREQVEGKSMDVDDEKKRTMEDFTIC